MPFAALDDEFHCNRKLLRVGFDGMGLFAASLSYCAGQMTDGVVPKAWVDRMCKDFPKLPGKLSRKSVWAPVEAGEIIELEDRSGNQLTLQVEEKSYLIPDYLQYNPSSVEIAERRAKKSRAGRVGAKRRWQPPSENDGTCHEGTMANAMAPAILRARARAGGPSPTHTKSKSRRDSFPSTEARPPAKDLPVSIEGDTDEQFELVRLLSEIKGSNDERVALRRWIGKQMLPGPFVIATARDELLQRKAKAPALKNEAGYVRRIIERYLSEKKEKPVRRAPSSEPAIE